jgi:hypothetical protein
LNASGIDSLSLSTVPPFEKYLRKKGLSKGFPQAGRLPVEHSIRLTGLLFSPRSHAILPRACARGYFPAQTPYVLSPAAISQSPKPAQRAISPFSHARKGVEKEKIRSHFLLPPRACARGYFPE